MAENLVVTSKVKKIIKDQGLRTGGSYISALSAKVEEMINASIGKLKQEGKRITLGAEDI